MTIIIVLYQNSLKPSNTAVDLKWIQVLNSKQKFRIRSYTLTM
jgi:hypothetical protein